MRTCGPSRSTGMESCWRSFITMPRTRRRRPTTGGCAGMFRASRASGWRRNPASSGVLHRVRRRRGDGKVQRRLGGGQGGSRRAGCMRRWCGRQRRGQSRSGGSAELEDGASYVSGSAAERSPRRRRTGRRGGQPQSASDRIKAAMILAFRGLLLAGRTRDVSCLHLGDIRIVHFRASLRGVPVLGAAANLARGLRGRALRGFRFGIHVHRPGV